MANEIIKEPWRLQFITQRTPTYNELEGARAVLEGGCRWIQLRMKDAEESEILSVGRKMRSLCNEYGAVFILDDHVELVELLNADGVHLGLKDMAIDEARRKLDNAYASKESANQNKNGACRSNGSARPTDEHVSSKTKIIGGTANCTADILLHYRRGADYIGCGPYRFTTTKKNLAPTLGLDGYRHIVSELKQTEAASLPLIAIGGIKKEDIKPILNTGMGGIAVSGAVLRAADPAAEIQEFVKIINQIQ